MSAHPKALSGLYYPFSRCISPASLKQMLLVFEELVFLDPVDDESWRAKLFRDLEVAEDKRFTHYRGVYNAIPTLFDEGVLRRLSPSGCSQTHAPSTSAAAISDLLDETWLCLASHPERYRMPYRTLAHDASPTWQIFSSKLPIAFVTALMENDNLRPHLVEAGDEYSSWTLSYAAGSSAAINVHLAAAEEHGLAPVTDSEMHHKLLLAKLVRKQVAEKSALPIDDDVALQLAQKVATSLVSDVLPQRALGEVSFEDILRFREETQTCRWQLIDEIGNRFKLIKRVLTAEELAQATREVESVLIKELRSYQAEFGATRDRLWPSLVSSANTTLATGSMAAVAMSYIGGPGHAITASIAAASLNVLKVVLDLRAERKKVERSTSPAVSYLSKIAQNVAH